VLPCEVAIVLPYRVRLDVNRVDGAAEVGCGSARASAGANFDAVIGPAIGCWNGRSGTIGKPFAVGAQQEDACKHIIPAHLFDGQEMSIENVL